MKDLEEKKERKPKKIKYTGNGTYLQDIPARDLEPEEWEKIPPKRRKHAVKLRLYKE